MDERAPSASCHLWTTWPFRILVYPDSISTLP
jgi:hypothetical protein